MGETMGCTQWLLDLDVTAAVVGWGGWLDGMYGGTHHTCMYLSIYARNNICGPEMNDIGF